MCMVAVTRTLPLIVADLCNGAMEKLVSPCREQHKHSMTLPNIFHSQAKAGDLVFFHSTYNAGSYVTHVGIYVGNNQMYHAGDPIGYADLSSSYWQQHLIGAGRVKQ